MTDLIGVENRAFFLAAGKSLETYEAIIQQRRECNSRRTAFMERIGAEKLVLHEYDVVGAIFKDGMPPAGWLKYRGHEGSHRPSEATKAGKALAREMRDTLSWQSFSRLGESHVSKQTIYFAIAQKLGDKIVISQHMDVKAVPADAVPIKRSEYMAMVEAQDEAKKGAAAA